MSCYLDIKLAFLCPKSEDSSTWNVELCDLSLKSFRWTKVPFSRLATIWAQNKPTIYQFQELSGYYMDPGALKLLVKYCKYMWLKLGKWSSFHRLKNPFKLRRHFSRNLIGHELMFKDKACFSQEQNLQQHKVT